MDFKPQTNQQPQQGHPAPRNERPVQVQNNSNDRKLIVIIVGVIVALALVCATVFMAFSNGNGSSDSGATSVDKDKYQALFMTNGQVYFGKLSNVDGNYTKLKDVYYLQVQQAVQPATDDKKTDPKVSLTKLGNELHGPTDEMNISRDQILFWENLKDDSTVVKAIKDYKDKQ